MRELPVSAPNPLNVYVSASSRGLAFEIARKFAQSGANIALSSRSAPHLEAARIAILAEVPHAQVLTVLGDISTVSGQEQIFSALDAGNFLPDVFVCSTGHPKEGTLSALTRAEWTSGLEMILGHAVFAAQRFAPTMAKMGFGRIVFLSSVYAKMPQHEFFLSSVARSALLALSKVIGHEYADRGVAAFVIGLGYIDTPLLRNRALGRPHDDPAPGVELAGDWTKTYEEWAGNIPAKRIASPEELAALVAFLVSPAADYLNGTVFNLAGGLDRGIL